MSAQNFRPVQYLGSKWRLLDHLQEHVLQVRDSRRPAMADLFAGTGVVTRHMAQSVPVFASDIQEYSRVLVSALTTPARLHDNDMRMLLRQVRVGVEQLLGVEVLALVEYEEDLLRRHTLESDAIADLVDRGSMEAAVQLSSVQPDDLSELLARAAKMLQDIPHSTMCRYYGGVYFSYRQALELDSIAQVAKGLHGASRDTVLAALLSTASELVGSVGGHFAQPMRLRGPHNVIKPALVRNVIRLRQVSAIERFGEWLGRYVRLTPALHTVRSARSDYRDTLAELPANVGVIYADPPYTREHYSRFYHVLETLALGDDPGLSAVRSAGITRPSRGLYRVDRHQSPFCVVSEAPSAFEILFKSVAERNVPLVLSYSPVPATDKPRARVVQIGTLRTRLAEHFSSVDVVPVLGLTHAKMNADRLNAERSADAELLFIARP